MLVMLHISDSKSSTFGRMKNSSVVENLPGGVGSCIDGQDGFPELSHLKDLFEVHLVGIVSIDGRCGNRSQSNRASLLNSSNSEISKNISNHSQIDWIFEWVYRPFRSTVSQSG